PVARRDPEQGATRRVSRRASNRLCLRSSWQCGARSRLANQGDDRPLLRDVLAGRVRMPDGQGVSERGPSLPSRLRNSATTIFRPLTASTAIRTLNNPRYAGAYAYGRRHYRRAADGKKILRKRESNNWLACIPNAHPGYITWEQFQKNLKTLKTNG